jgi:hypothetical protein
MKKILGYIWASPVTLIGLIYSCLFWLLKWHKWQGIEHNCLIWQINRDKAPKWLLKLWTNWNGHAIGNVVVLNTNDPKTLIHESKHVDQVMRLGVFQPIFYLLNMLIIYLGCSGSHPYRDNIFETDARKHTIKYIMGKINDEN